RHITEPRAAAVADLALHALADLATAIDDRDDIGRAAVVVVGAADLVPAGAGGVADVRGTDPDNRVSVDRRTPVVTLAAEVRAHAVLVAVDADRLALGQRFRIRDLLSLDAVGDLGPAGIGGVAQLLGQRILGGLRGFCVLLDAAALRLEP